MRNIPVFDTEHGVASLILKEIPYTRKAYITIQSSQEPELLLEECISFCRMCGAESIYASGHNALEKYPLYTAMWQMRCLAEVLPDTDAALWPVQAETLEKWRNIYNEKVTRIPNGAWMDTKDAQEMLQKGDGYFIHREGELLGIGRASGDVIDWVASVKPGAGRDVVLALRHAVSEESLHLTVASVNEKAIKLYESLGFIATREISRWHKVL